MAITHTFVSAKGDSGDTTLVRPSDWNAGHVGSWADIRNSGDFVAGSTTAGIQEAIDDLPAAGGMVFVPAGTHDISTEIVVWKGKVHIAGAGPHITVIRTTAAAINGFHFGSQPARLEWLSISDLAITSTVAKTGGSAILCDKASWCLIENVLIMDQYVGISLSDVYYFWGDNIVVWDADSVGVYVGGGVGLNCNVINLSNCDVHGSLTDPYAGYQLTNVDDFTLRSCRAGGCESGIRLQPDASMFVEWGWITDCMLEGNERGIFVAPATGAIVKGIHVFDTWASSNTYDGIYAYAAGGQIDGLTVVGLRAFSNGNDGIRIEIGEAIHIDNCEIAGNSATTSDVSSGIYVAAGVSEFAIRNCRIGQMAGQLNSQKYGIEVAAGASDHYMIALNDTRLNVTGGILDGGTGADKRVVDNIGYVTRNYGTSAAIASGATIAHGLVATPTKYWVMPTVTGLSNIFVTAGAANLTVTFAGGGSNVFTWEAEV